MSDYRETWSGERYRPRDEGWRGEQRRFGRPDDPASQQGYNGPRFGNFGQEERYRDDRPAAGDRASADAMTGRWEPGRSSAAGGREPEGRSFQGYGQEHYPRERYDHYGQDMGRSFGPSRPQGLNPPERYGDYRDDGNRGGERGWWDRTTDQVSSWFGDRDAERRRTEDGRRTGQDAGEFRSDQVGDHRGRGPRGYTRSDERIREDVSERLMESPVVDASDIEVSVSGGDVVLSGTVDSRYTKRIAEETVDRVLGVKNVQNNLRVRQTGTTGSGEPGFGNGNATHTRASSETAQQGLATKM